MGKSFYHEQSKFTCTCKQFFYGSPFAITKAAVNIENYFWKEPLLLKRPFCHFTFKDFGDSVNCAPQHRGLSEHNRLLLPCQAIPEIHRLLRSVSVPPVFEERVHYQRLCFFSHCLCRSVCSSWSQDPEDIVNVWLKSLLRI